MMTVVYIAMAGALGTLGRYLVSVGARHLLGESYPYGTFAVNIVGSFVMGLAMMHFVSRGQIDSHVRMALTIGFLGGFTTYSSFAYETVELIESQRLLAAAGYVALTLIVAALACYGGMAAARAFAST